jgi:hypothetical protein
MSGAITFLPLHAFIAWNGDSVLLPFEGEVNESGGCVYWESNISIFVCFRN